MSNSETFSILSVGASLVEVQGDGPYSDRPGGLLVPNGSPTTAGVALLTDPIRKWRVEGGSSVQATVSITDSPFGAFVGVRRCVTKPVLKKRWHPLAVANWPRLRAALKRVTPTLVAIWYLATDDLQPCTWGDVGDNSGTQVMARGGDVVVVTFVSP